MIKVLKESPITVEGKDCYLQLIYDDAIYSIEACNYCYYRDWENWSECCASCCEVHRCHPYEPTYFKLTDL